MNTRAASILLLLMSLLPVVGCDKASPVAPSGSILAVSANPTRIGLNGQSTITVIGRQPDGNPFNPGTEIRLSASLGTIPSIVTTDRTGTAVATFTSNGLIGTAMITASTGTGGGGGTTTSDTGSSSGVSSATVSIQVGSAAKTIILQPTPISIPSATTTKVKLLAIVRDGNGQPLANQGVNFGTDLGTLNSKGGIVTTDSLGQAKDTLTITEQDLLNNPTAIHVTVQSATNDGTLISAMATIQVVSGLPMAHFSYAPLASDHRQVQFNNASTGVGTLTYDWNFGDGTPDSSEQNPLHKFTQDTTQNISLTVTDSNGNASVARASFTTPLTAGGSSTP
jgi:hypothetical protein